MGKRSSTSRSPSAAARSLEPNARPATRVRPRFALIAFAIVLSGLLPVLLEVALQICGYGYSTSFFEANGSGNITTNPKFAWQFYARETTTIPTPLLFPRQKAPGTYRIFVFGESAAAGTPDPAFGFARQLEVMLGAQFPSNRFEVLNTAVRGINSYIIRQIARECAALSPDLFLVYMGNNELIGLHSPSERTPVFGMNPILLRLQDAAKSTKLAQLADAMRSRFQRGRLPAKQDMPYIRSQRLALDHPCRQAVYRNFKGNLNEICETINRSGAPAILCSVAANTRDFPPLGSLHRRDLAEAKVDEWNAAVAEGAVTESRGEFGAALQKYESALQIDDHYAELHYRIARCHDRLGHRDRAESYYRLARDWDALQFRADGPLNRIVADAASESGQAIRFLNIDQALTEVQFQDTARDRQPLFLEYVHFTFHGDYEAARLLFPAVATALKLPTHALVVLSETECARRLAYTPVDDVNVRSAIVRLMSHPPFLDQLDHAERQKAAEQDLQRQLKSLTDQDMVRAIEARRRAVAGRPGDWMLRYHLADLLTDAGLHGEAAPEYEKLVALFPKQKAFRLALGRSLLRLGRAREAREQFEAILQNDPGCKPAQQALSLAGPR